MSATTITRVVQTAPHGAQTQGEKMETKQNEYTPRPGSKIAIAIDAMAGGPAHVEKLAMLMRVAANDVPTRLHCAIQNNLVVKVVDSFGAVHFMRACDPVPEGYKRPGHVGFNTADPFGLVGKRKGSAPRAEKPEPRTYRTPFSPIKPRGPQSAASRDGEFLAALFSTGELMIQVGDDQVVLSPEHQRKLQEYCARFERDGQ